MLYILTGNDQTKKLARLNLIIEGLGAAKEELGSKILPRLDQISGSVLFGVPSVLVLDDALEGVIKQGLTQQLVTAKRVFVLLVGILKTSEIKELEKHGAKIENYSAPETEQELLNWSVEFCKLHQRQVKPEVISKLISRLGLQPPFDIVKLQTELEKLISASESEINLNLVEALVHDNQIFDIWALSNALAEKNSPRILEALDKYFSTSSEDEKSVAITLAGQISEQIRNLLLVKSAVVPDQKILTDTGWKPARLSIMKRSANRFSETSLIAILKKMESLDLELKRTTTPPKMLLTLILTQI